MHSVVRPTIVDYTDSPSRVTMFAVSEHVNIAEFVQAKVAVVCFRPCRLRIHHLDLTDLGGVWYRHSASENSTIGPRPTWSMESATSKFPIWFFASTDREDVRLPRRPISLLW